MFKLASSEMLAARDEADSPSASRSSKLDPRRICTSLPPTGRGAHDERKCFCERRLDRQFALDAIEVQVGLQPLRCRSRSTHANAVETMLSRKFLRRSASVRLLELLVLLVLALLLAWMFARVRVGLALPALFAAGAALWAANLALFRAGYDVMAALPLIEIGSIFVLVTTYRYAVEERDRRALRKAFQLYLNSDVMDEMLRQPEKLQLGGEERELTVLFSDIRGFTAISEKLPPKALVHLLNEYLSPMTDIVFAKRGTLDKYIGDAVMAFFGAPVENPRHALHCCEVALDMVEELARLRRKWRAANPEIPHLEIGVGVNSGKMVVGNMGSTQRFNYTVMGDNVNPATAFCVST